MPSCTYDLQFANDEVVDKGHASAAEILRAFDEFDWPGQVEQANQLQKCSPTFSVQDPESQRHFWVSAAGEPGDFVFVNHYTYLGPERRVLGFRRPPKIVGAPTGNLAPIEARACIDLFVSGDHGGLLARLARAQ